MLASQINNNQLKGKNNFEKCLLMTSNKYCSYFQWINQRILRLINQILMRSCHYAGSKFTGSKGENKKKPAVFNFLV